MANDVFFLRLAAEMFFEDDSDDENATVLYKTYGFAEETVSNFSDRQFQSHFRMTPTTFENLFRRIGELGEHTRIDGNPEIPLEKQLMITIWYFSNIESFR